MPAAISSQPAEVASRRCERYADIRFASEILAAPLTPEDQCLQSMPDASPTKWHMAHTTWFFETFVLQKFEKGYSVYHPRFNYLFNSYYEAVGQRHPRPQRGLISRPGVTEVMAYRRHVDAAIEKLLERSSEPEMLALVELGLHHEQQHQELMLMDIKHLFWLNPLRPAYAASSRPSAGQTAPMEWKRFEGGLSTVGHAGEAFAFDNEGPRHKVWLDPYALATRPITCAEYFEFIESGGYRKPEFWLSDGWAAVKEQGWDAPQYWEKNGNNWEVFTLSGMQPVNPSEPVCHVSHYEASAFAKWAGARLPTEAEWEQAALAAVLAGYGAQNGWLHPRPAPTGPGMQRMLGDVWEWTASAYAPYPGFREAPGALGEYNGKFMSNQMVLRGGCAVTPPDHIRITYRNFFPPVARWVFAGIRLAMDVT